MQHEATQSVAAALGLFIAMLAFATADAQARSSGLPRTEPITLVVIHTTGGPTCGSQTGKPIWVGAGTLEENMRHIEAHPRLGIHYMIDRSGRLRASVPEEQIAHHIFRYSARSLAIELVNDGDGRDPFPQAQLDSLVSLVRDIQKRRGIKRDGFQRHSDLDAGLMPCDKTQRRKVDPGAAYPHEEILRRVFDR